VERPDRFLKPVGSDYQPFIKLKGFPSKVGNEAITLLSRELGMVKLTTLEE
jgi:hypothetical protein